MKERWREGSRCLISVAARLQRQDRLGEARFRMGPDQYMQLLFVSLGGGFCDIECRQ